MLIGIPRESLPGETRVAATPATVGQLIKLGYSVVVEPGAHPVACPQRRVLLRDQHERLALGLERIAELELSGILDDDGNDGGTHRGTVSGREIAGWGLTSRHCVPIYSD